MKKVLGPVALAVSLAAGSLAVPSMASAEVSASLGVSNMYLWRGQNLTPTGAAVDGGLQFDHESGFYAGTWMTSETGGHETDLYLGFGGTIGDTGIGYDVSYWKYLYPEDGTNVSLGDNDASDVVIGLSYEWFSFAAYLGAETDNDADSDGKNDDFADNNYFTVGAAYDKYSITYGWWDYNTTAFGANEYSHITLGYAYNDNLSFAVSFADNDVADNAATAVEEDPLFQVRYSLSF